MTWPSTPPAPAGRRPSKRGTSRPASHRPRWSPGSNRPPPRARTATGTRWPTAPAWHCCWWPCWWDGRSPCAPGAPNSEGGVSDCGGVHTHNPTRLNPPGRRRSRVAWAPLRAIQITELTGPDGALQLVELAEPEPSHPFSPGSGVIVDVHAAGVSFPELLQTRGQYQIKPALPWVPGSEVAGVVRQAPSGSRVQPGDRVAAFCMLGGWASVAVAPEVLTFALPDQLDFAQGAGLILNYHTAYFALATRGRVSPGETVLVHGAAGGVGTAAIQVA